MVGGGLCIAVENDLKYDPVLVMKGEDEVELMVVEIIIGTMSEF